MIGYFFIQKVLTKQSNLSNWMLFLLNQFSAASSKSGSSTCNLNPPTSASFLSPDPANGQKVEQYAFGDAIELKWELADSSVSINAAVQLLLPNTIKAQTIAIIGGSTSYSWNATNTFVDAITGKSVVLQNTAGYYFLIHDNNTGVSSTGQTCQGGIADCTSKEIQFFTSGGLTGSNRRSDGTDTRPGIFFLSLLFIAAFSTKI
eukprot:NODE_138_length_17968_cov_0.291175.p6 type:complete len:204 gc:universal NODE_138_length_17968_cov_0.291175:7947-8558(+)